MTGMQRYAAELVGRFRSGPHVIAPGVPLKGVRGHLWEQSVLPSRIGSRLLWSPCGTGPLAISRQVVTIHDIIPIDRPEWFSRSFAALHGWLVPRLVERVRHIITVSQYTKQRLIERFFVKPERITVIPNGIGEEFYPRPQAEIERVKIALGMPPGRYVLSVCSLEPRKNLKRVLEAWDMVEPGRDLTLVVTGAKGGAQVFRDPDIKTRSRRVLFTGYVPGEDLPALYSGAGCFVYPSLYEGFGLPVLEALACGVPVVASDLTSIPEICGPSTILVRPDDVGEIASAIARVVDTPEAMASLAELGRAHAARFSWKSCADLTEKLLLSLN